MAGTALAERTPARQPTASSQGVESKKSSKTFAVKRGDLIVVVTSIPPVWSIPPAWFVEKIDAKGVELKSIVELSDCENTISTFSGRVDYGKQMRLGEFAIFLAMDAEKGSEQGPANHTVTVILAGRSGVEIHVIKSRSETHKLKEGDTIPGFHFTRIEKIDDRGIVTKDGERLDYGKRRRMGEFLLYSEMEVLKGTEPGTVIVNITTNAPQTEVYEIRR
jgi:hypothetical protein